MGAVKQQVRANASKFLPLLLKKEHVSQKPQNISECFIRLTREYTDVGTNIR